MKQLSDKYIPIEEIAEMSTVCIGKLFIDQLEFTVRAYNCLVVEDIVSIRQLATSTELDLKKVPNLGNKTIKELKEQLGRIGLCLGMDDALFTDEITALMDRTEKMVGFVRKSAEAQYMDLTSHHNSLKDVVESNRQISQGRYTKIVDRLNTLEESILNILQNPVQQSVQDLKKVEMSKCIGSDIDCEFADDGRFIKDVYIDKLLAVGLSSYPYVAYNCGEKDNHKFCRPRVGFNHHNPDGWTEQPIPDGFLLEIRQGKDWVTADSHKVVWSQAITTFRVVRMSAGYGM